MAADGSIIIDTRLDTSGINAGAVNLEKSYTGLTELSHLETVRRYGLVPAIMIFVFVWLKPVVTIISKEKSLLKYFYMILLVSYIFVACTNPFLLGSIGFCALLFMSTFFERGFL